MLGSEPRTRIAARPAAGLVIGDPWSRRQRVRPHIAAAAAAGLTYALLSVFLNGSLQVYPSGIPGWSPLAFVLDGPARFSFLYPVIIWTPNRFVYLAASWWSLTVATGSGLLVTLIVLTLIDRPRQRRGSAAGLLGALPGVFAGFGCCASGPLLGLVGGTLALRLSSGLWPGVLGGASLGLLCLALVCSLGRIRFFPSSRCRGG
jgi:hypothetical protein